MKKKKSKVKFKLPKIKIEEPERTILTMFGGILERKTVSEINRFLDERSSK